MSDNAFNFRLVLLSAAMDVFFFGGTAFLVFFHGESGWWFVLTLVLSQGLAEFIYKVKRP